MRECINCGISCDNYEVWSQKMVFCSVSCSKIFFAKITDKGRARYKTLDKFMGGVEDG